MAEHSYGYFDPEWRQLRDKTHDYDYSDYC